MNGVSQVMSNNKFEESIHKAEAIILPAFLLVFSMSIMMITFAFSEIKIGNNHCVDCPGHTCLCIKDTKGKWMLSPEVGE